MWGWITANLATLLISAALAAIVAAVIAVMIRNRKKGRSPCGCGCSGCALKGKCRKQ